MSPGSDELLFEVVNIQSGANGQICSLSVGAAAVKLNSVNRTYIVDIDGIPVFYGKRSIRGQGRRAAFLGIFFRAAVF